MLVIETSLSAVLAAGLPLAFRDRQRITLTGKTLRGEEATRALWVCGPGAFLVLKALAFRGRGEPKDAYDLLYVLENSARPTFPTSRTCSVRSSTTSQPTTPS